MFKLIAEIVFYGLMLMFALFSFAMIFTLLKYSKSIALGLTVAAVFLIVMFSLFATALANFNHIEFPIF
ncbi:MAG: hypothetical protein Q8R08_02215 [bacterium]|nr:hypothetical protein [bacterium]